MQSIRQPKPSEAESGRLLAEGRHADPFGFLGPHADGGAIRIRSFQPQAASVDVVDCHGRLLSAAQPVGADGLFAAEFNSHPGPYRLRLTAADGSTVEIEDVYRFGSVLGDLDLHLIGEGLHHLLYEKLGAHPDRRDGIDGVRFGIWAPNAWRVSVIGGFNDWDGRRHVMRRHPAVGIWDLFIPGIKAGELYKFELLDAAGRMLPLKSDPYAFRCEPPPGNASIVHFSSHAWQDADWLAERRRRFGFDQPISIYEVHAGSWRRKVEDSGRWLSYSELADELIPYVRRMGFTHIEFLPVNEHPFGGSWGYQPVGLFAPTHRHGSPDEFRELVDRCHRNGLGVVLDWVAAHFPTDVHGLGRFDGTALYEHDDPRRGLHADWNTFVYNYGRAEVANYLIANALFWIREFHVDALRIDAVASMLYLDYSRHAGQWLPNQYGGNEDLDAIAFLRRLNTLVHAEGAVTIAEESTAWPGVTRPADNAGLGFSYKWNMGWMNDTLNYMSEDPVHRRYHHDRMSFSMIYAYNENFVLPLSHDEVVHGKHSILGRMPGDAWQQFANLRAYYAYMFAHPGKKLLFMGNEFAQTAEWHHDRSLDWHLLDVPPHAGVSRLVQDLNRLYREVPALHEIDYEPAGFCWLDCSDREASVFAFARLDRLGDILVSISNFTPVIRQDYVVRVPVPGDYAEILNTDATVYGGSGVGNLGTARAIADGGGRLPASLCLQLPPLATLWLRAPAPRAQLTGA